MISKNNKTFTMQDCRRECSDNNKNGKANFKNQTKNNKSDCIIKKCSQITKRILTGKHDVIKIRI